MRRIKEKDLLSWLNKKRGARNIAEFARDLGLKRENLSIVLSGRRRPGLKLRRQLHIVGVELVYLVEE